jgi:hypothetical protein
MRRMTMKTWLLLMVLMWSALASAQTLLPCTSNCPSRYYWETQPCASGVCARSTSPAASEFLANRGMSLASPYEGAMIQICAASGQTLTGTGTLRVWAWNPWLPLDPSTTKQLVLHVSDVWVDSACNGSACRCVHWTDWRMGGYSARRVMVEAVDVGVTGGSALEVRLVGLEAIR